MTNLLLHNYYYRYKEHRKQLKNNINVDDFTGAKAILDSVVAEHDNKYPLGLMMSRVDFNLGEHFILYHAKRHIDEYILNGDSPYIDKDGNPKTQKDNILEILELSPKQDYSSIL